MISALSISISGDFMMTWSAERKRILICLVALLSGCSGDGEDPPGVAIPPLEGTPVAVTDLAATGGGSGTVDLAWTSPDLVAKAGGLQYELRYTLDDFLDTAPGTWVVAPAPDSDTGSQVAHLHTVAGLSSGEVYVFVLRATTDGSTWSDFSNLVVATAAEQWDTTAPAMITDLSYWSGTPTSLTVDWSPTGDDGPLGEASGYEVRYATAPFDAAGWAQATAAAGEIVPAHDPARLQTTITDLVEGQLYHLAVRAVDDQGNLSALAPLLAVTAGQGRIWHVNVEGTGDQSTIEAAVDLAGPGDEIVVGPGRYTWTNQGTGDFYGMILIARDHTGFTLRSEAGPEETILDAENLGGVIHIQGYNDIVIEGFTITRGNVDGDGQQGEPYAGGGISSHLASPLIRDCIIRWNYATEGGGLWLGSTGQPRLENCIIEFNEAVNGGGVALVNDALLTSITGCTIRNNTAAGDGGALLANNVLFTLENCLITGNNAGQRGGGLSISTVHDGCQMIACTLADNDALLGSAIRISANCEPAVQSSNIVFNTGGPAFSTDLSASLAMGCSNVFGHPEGEAYPDIFTDLGGNFSANPLFCGVGVYTLQEGSPCLAGQHPDGAECGLVGSEPVGCSATQR